MITGSPVEVQRPANFNDAVKKLGLEHALGSLRLMRTTPFNSSVSNENTNANLPTESQSIGRQEAVQGQDAQKIDSSAWVPLQLQLGLPLAPAELCDLVCR